MFQLAFTFNLPIINAITARSVYNRSKYSAYIYELAFMYWMQYAYAKQAYSIESTMLQQRTVRIKKY